MSVDGATCAEAAIITNGETAVVPCKASAGSVVRVGLPGTSTEPLILCEVRLLKTLPSSDPTFTEMAEVRGCSSGNWENEYDGPAACSVTCNRYTYFTVVSGADNNCACSNTCTNQRNGQYKAYHQPSATPEENKTIGTLQFSSKNCAECAASCASHLRCRSYECAPAGKGCRLNYGDPQAVRWESQLFCNKMQYGAPLGVAAATASKSVSQLIPSNMVDGNPSTRWSSGAKAASGTYTWIAFKLSTASTVGRVKVDWETAKASIVSFYGRPEGKTSYTVIRANYQVPFGLKGTNFYFDPVETFKTTHLKMEFVKEHGAGGYGTSIFDVQLFGLPERTRGGQGTTATQTTTTSATTTPTTTTTTTIFKEVWELPCPGRSADGGFMSRKQWEKSQGFVELQTIAIKQKLPGGLDGDFTDGLLLTEGFALYWTFDTDAETVSAALHCNHCAGWMAFGIPNKASGNAMGKMVASHAIIGACSDTGVNIAEYALTQYHISGVNRLSDDEQSLSETSCKKSQEGVTIYFKRPKRSGVFKIPVGEDTGDKLIWAVGESNTVGKHKTLEAIAVAGEGPGKGGVDAAESALLADLQRLETTASMGSLYWPVAAAGNAAVATAAIPTVTKPTANELNDITVEASPASPTFSSTSATTNFATTSSAAADGDGDTEEASGDGSTGSAGAIVGVVVGVVVLVIVVAGLAYVRMRQGSLAVSIWPRTPPQANGQQRAAPTTVNNPLYENNVSSSVGGSSMDVDIDSAVLIINDTM